MVKSLLEWLLDLEDIRLARDAPLLLEWRNPIDAWIVFCFAILAFCWIGLIYRREQTSTGAKTGLAVVRAALIALVLIVIGQPALVLQRNRVEPSSLAVAVDTSHSMATAESYVDPDLATATARGAGIAPPASGQAKPERLTDHSRLWLLQAALTRETARANPTSTVPLPGSTPLQILLEKQGVSLWSFAGQTENAGFFASTRQADDLTQSIHSLTPEGASTDLVGALRHILSQSQGRRLSAIVLATDGQTTQPGNLRDVLDAARGRGIPIFPIRIGSTHRPRDISVGSARTRGSVFLDDILAVEARVEAQGLVEPTSLTVRLVDRQTNRTVTEQQITLDPENPQVTVELRTKPTRLGVSSFRVEVPPLDDESTTENNAEHVEVVVVENLLRVLYVEAYPRYEYRYLKNALLREKTMETSVLLIEADEAFVQEGTDPIRRFPQTPEELNRFDVVLFGDVDPRGGWLTDAQMTMLWDFVGNRGGGFGLLAGERAAPHRFLGTPLQKLIPVQIDPTFRGHYDLALTTGFALQLTPEGRASQVFRFAADPIENERLVDSLPELFWMARTLGPKPGATVLAQHPTTQSESGPMPLVVTSRYGAGKLLFQATDDTWRWRRGSGELLHDTYWVQVIRDLVRGSQVAGDRRLILRTDRRSYGYGASVQVQVEIHNAALLASQGDRIELSVIEVVPKPDDTDDAPAAAATDESIVGRFTAARVGADANIFEGRWVPPGPGTYAVSLADLPTSRGEPTSSALFRVASPNLESLHPEADHAILERIAEVTGGRVIELDELDVAFGAIEDRSVQIPDDVVEPLWDSKLALALFALLLSTEWILRKGFGLL